MVPGISKPLGIGPPVGMQKRPLEFWEPFLRNMDTCRVYTITRGVFNKKKVHTLFCDYPERRTVKYLSVKWTLQLRVDYKTGHCNNTEVRQVHNHSYITSHVLTSAKILMLASIKPRWWSESPTSFLIVSRWLSVTSIMSSPRRHMSIYMYQHDYRPSRSDIHTWYLAAITIKSQS